MSVITRGIRNAFRNSTRTFSIAVILGLSLGLCLAMLVAHQAVGDKIQSVKGTVGNTVSVSPAGVRGFEGGGNALTQTQLAPIAKLAHVISVEETLSDRLTSSNTSLQSSLDLGSLGKRFAATSGAPVAIEGASGSGGQAGTNFTPPITVTGSTNPTDLSAVGEGNTGTFTLKSGNIFSASNTDKVALVGSDLANKNSLKVGSTFSAYGTTITVVGVFDAGNTFGNSQLIMPLATVQSLSGQSGAISSATVNVDSISNVNAVTTAVHDKLGSAADVTNASQRAQQSIAPLQNIQSISLYSLIGAAIAGAVIILLTMIMIVRERRREIGVIKAIGASNVRVMLQFMIEATTLTLLGAVIGIVLGVVAGNPITHLLVTNSTSAGNGPVGGPGGGRGFGFFRNNVSAIHAAVGWGIILDGIVAAIVIGVVGSALASFFIARIRPAEVMRVE